MRWAETLCFKRTAWGDLTVREPPPAPMVQRTPKGGQNSGGGGQNLTRRDPTKNSFRPPLPRYVPPPIDPLENSFRRVSKNGFRRAILARFCPPPPPLFCPPLWLRPAHEMRKLRPKLRASDHGELQPPEFESTVIDSVQTRCIVKGEAQKSPLFWRFSGGF